MIEKVMDYCNNHFLGTREVQNVEFSQHAIMANTINEYLVGQYILIKNTILNDGVYKIMEIDGSLITVDKEVQEEAGPAIIYGLKVPQAFLAIVDKVNNYTTVEGISSERLGDYSVSYGSMGSGGSGWQNAFKGELMQYKRPFDDLMGWYYDRGR